MEQIKTVIKFLIALTTTPEQTWSYLADQGAEDSDVDRMHRQFYLPWLITASAIILVLKVLYSYSHDLDQEASLAVANGMRQMVPFLVSYFAAPFVSVALLREVYPLFLQLQVEKRRLEIFVSYAMSFVILVDVLCALVSHFRMVAFVGIYLVYLVWLGSNTYIRVNEKKRWKFTVVTSVVIYLLPLLLSQLLYYMIR